MTDSAIKKWSYILSNISTIDTATYLVTSIIPISYILTIGNDALLVVDLSDIRNNTTMAKEGSDFLVSRGFAKWVKPIGKKASDRVNDYSRISIGIIDNPYSMKAMETYYFESKNRVSTATSMKSHIEEDTHKLDLTHTIQKLDRLYDRYKLYCARVRSNTKAEKIHSIIKAIIHKGLRNARLTEIDILNYLDSINAMTYDWLDIPKGNIKERAMAKKVLIKYSTEDIINGIPYFIEHYPKLAKAGYEDTNIYMLSFHFQRLLTLMKADKQTTASYEEDAL